MNNLPKKFLKVAQIFAEQSKGNEGHRMHQQWPTYEVKISLITYESIIRAKKTIQNFREIPVAVCSI